MTAIEQHELSVLRIAAESNGDHGKLEWKVNDHVARWEKRMSHRKERLRIKHELYLKYANRYGR